jgi:hypothetical protein
VGALLLLAACSSGEQTPSTNPTTSASVASGPSSSAGPPTSAPPTTPAAVTLSITDLRLINSEESDNALRILVESAAPELTVTVTGVPSPNRVILVCPANELARRTAPATGCVTPASGEAVKVPHGEANKGVEIVQVGVSGAGAAGNSTAIGEVTISYPATSRQVQFRLPPLPPGDAGRPPSFRMTPAGAGAYQATAAFTPAVGNQGEAELTLVTGSATTNQARGSGPSLSGNLNPPVEATIRLRNSGSVALTALTLTAQFP